MADKIYTLNGDQILAFPFNAIEQGGVFDRLWDAVDFAAYYHLFVSNGVYPNPSTNLKVVSLYNNMTVNVSTGIAFIQGYGYMQKKAIESIQIDPANPTLKRIDEILLRLDLVNRHIVIIYRAGTPNATPTVPPPIRTDDIYEFRLAEITINAAAAAITTANILDTRPNGTVCGFMTGVVNSVDTTALYAQYEDFLNFNIANWNAIQIEETAKWQARMDTLQAETDKLVIIGQGVQTGIFTLINNDFDDTSVKYGCNYEPPTFDEVNDTIFEQWTIKESSQKLATRLTEFYAVSGVDFARVTTIFYANSIIVNGNTITSKASNVKMTINLETLEGSVVG